MLELLAWGDTGWGDELVRGTLMTLAVALCSFALGQVFGGLGEPVMGFKRGRKSFVRPAATVLRP